MSDDGDKITELDALTIPAGEDTFAVVEFSDIPNSPKEMNLDNLFGGMPKSSAINVVAASDTPDAKPRSDYQCDGIADEVQIHAALAALPAGGGTVFLLSGTYAIAAQIDVPADNITIRGEGKSTKLELAADTAGIYIDGFDYCVVEDLFIEGTGGAKIGTAEGIRLNDAEHCIVRNCWIKDVQHEGIWARDGCKWIMIQGNWVTGSADNNIDVGSNGTTNEQVSIIGNHSSGNRDDFGIKIAAKAINCIIANNTVECAVAGGIAIHWSAITPELDAYNNAIVGNIVFGGVAAEVGIQIHHLNHANGGTFTVQGNAISGCPGYGMFIFSSTDGSIVGNVIEECDYGIWLRQTGRVTITGNELRLNTNDGIYLEDSSFNIIASNFIMEDAATGEHCIHLLDTSHKCVINGNTCLNAPGGFDGVRIDDDTDNCIVSNNVCSGCQVGVHIVVNTCDKNLIIGNMLLNNTAALTDAGTGTVNEHNVVA